MRAARMVRMDGVQQRWWQLGAILGIITHFLTAPGQASHRVLQVHWHSLALVQPPQVLVELYCLLDHAVCPVCLLSLLRVVVPWWPVWMQELL